MNDKILKGKCSGLLRGYEDVLQYLIEEEKYSLSRKSRAGMTDAFLIAKDVIYDEGMIRGMKRMIEKLYEKSSKDSE